MRSSLCGLQHCYFDFWLFEITSASRLIVRLVPILLCRMSLMLGWSLHWFYKSAVSYDKDVHFSDLILLIHEHVILVFFKSFINILTFYCRIYYILKIYSKIIYIYRFCYYNCSHRFLLGYFNEVLWKWWKFVSQFCILHLHWICFQWNLP